MSKQPPKPRLSDIESAASFKAGDRILVRVSRSIAAHQRRNIERSVRKWTGEHVRVLVVNSLDMELFLYRDSLSEPDVLVEADHSPKESNHPSVANLNCSKVEFRRDDLLVAKMRFPITASQRKNFLGYLQDWAGPNVEVRIVGVAG